MDEGKLLMEEEEYFGSDTCESPTLKTPKKKKIHKTKESKKSLTCAVWASN